MSNQELLLQIEEPMIHLRTNIDRARVIMGDLMTRYFQDLTNDPTTNEGRKWIAHGFKPYGIRAGVVEDALFSIDEQLSALEQIISQIEDKSA